jgi:hypothetical protein
MDSLVCMKQEAEEAAVRVNGFCSMYEAGGRGEGGEGY